MTEPIRGKVARILNSREMVINVGAQSGVAVGMRFEVMDIKGEDIRDPDTGELLGSLERPKVRVEVSKVEERLSVASTYKQETVNVGGAGMGTAIGTYSLSGLFMPAKWETRYETLKTEEKTWEDLEEEDSYVKTGDPVVQVVADASVLQESKRELGETDLSSESAG
jgi:hypothetical protein